MSNITGTIRAKATIEAGANPVIYNVPCAVANTEYSQALPSNVKKIAIRCRGIATRRIAFASGDTTVSWITIPRGCSFSEDGINLSGSVFFQTNEANQTIEVLAWT